MTADDFSALVSLVRRSLQMAYFNINASEVGSFAQTRHELSAAQWERTYDMLLARRDVLVGDFADVER